MLSTKLSGRLAATVIALMLGGHATAAEVVRVNVVNGHPPVFLWVKHLTETFIPTVDAALEGTDYTIEWSESYGGTLAAVGGEMEALEDGLAEVGIIPTVFEPTALPLQNVSYFTPFGTADARIVLETMDALHQEMPAMAESWHKYGIEYLGGGFALDNYILMTNFPVQSIDDLKGHKIAAPGAAVNWLEGTGSVGVSGNLTTYYSDLQTGVFEGVITFPTAAAPAKLAEVAPHILKVDFGAQYAGSVVANKEWLEDQPQEIRDALRAGASAYTEAFIIDQQAQIDAAYEAIAAAGGMVKEMDAPEKQRWADAIPDIAAIWTEAAEAEALPAQDVLSAYMKGLAQRGAVPLRDWADE